MPMLLNSLWDVHETSLEKSKAAFGANARKDCNVPHLPRSRPAQRMSASQILAAIMLRRSEAFLATIVEALRGPKSSLILDNNWPKSDITETGSAVVFVEKQCAIG